MSLATKYRPQTFEDVVGQDHITKIIEHQIETGQFSHNYILCGVTGGGKTTIARLIHKYLNKGNGIPIEIDAASNSGVDNVRNIIMDAQERSLDSEYKVYIIDEAQALSSAAWQAFLKCIETPPKYTIFIFCTTEYEKIPDAIKNRCQTFSLKFIPANKIEDRLNHICQEEGASSYEESTKYISRIANGSMRNALSLMDKCISFTNNLAINRVMKILGNYSYDGFFKLINAIIDGNQAGMFEEFNSICDNGCDYKNFVDQFLDFCIDVNKYAIFNNCNLIKIPASMVKDLDYAAGFENAPKYYNLVIDKLLKLKNMVKYESNPRICIEVVLTQLARGQFND